MSQERWRAVPVDGLRQRYQVSNHGRVRRRKDREILNASLFNGSLAVRMTVDRWTHKRMSVGRLVLMAWCSIENPRSYDVEWIDGDVTNNRLENLRWILHQPNAKFTDDQVRTIRARAAKGETHIALSREYRVNEMTIGYIVNRVSYPNVPDVEDIDETSI